MGFLELEEGLVAELNNGLDANSVGDERYDLPRIMPSSTQRDIVGVFGPDAARIILAIDDDQWHGPFESRLGANIVRITGHNSAIDPPFESVEQYLEGEWRLAKTRERVELEIEKLRDDYEIVVEGMGSEQ